MRKTTFLLLLVFILTACTPANATQSQNPTNTPEINQAATQEAVVFNQVLEGLPTDKLLAEEPGVNTFSPPTLKMVPFGEVSTSTLPPLLVYLEESIKSQIPGTASVEFTETTSGDYQAMFIPRDADGNMLWSFLESSSQWGNFAVYHFLDDSVTMDGVVTEGINYKPIPYSQDAVVMWGPQPVVVKNPITLEDGTYAYGVYFDFSSGSWAILPDLQVVDGAALVDGKVFMLNTNGALEEFSTEGAVFYQLADGVLTAFNENDEPLLQLDEETGEWREAASPLTTELPLDYQAYAKELRLVPIEVEGEWYMRKETNINTNRDHEEYNYKFKWNAELSAWEVFVPETVPLYYTKDMDLNLMYEIANDPAMQAAQLKILSRRYAELLSVDQLVPMKIGGHRMLLRYNSVPFSDGFVGQGGGFYFLQVQQDYNNSAEALLMPLKVQGIDVEDAFVGVFPMLLGKKEMMPMFVMYEDGKIKNANPYLKGRDFFTYFNADVLSVADELEGDVIVQTLRLYFNKNAPDKNIPTWVAIARLNQKYPNWEELIIYAMKSYGSDASKDSQVKEMLSQALFSAYYDVGYRAESLDM